MDVRKLNIGSALEAFSRGEFTPLELAEQCLSNVKRHKDLNFIVSVNPMALESAADSTERIRTGLEMRRLECIPVLATGYDMPTTAGAGVMKGILAKAYADTAELLRKEGAVIIGKTNMTEWAHFTSTDMPFGFSCLGGQTYNYYGRDLEVFGSSSGSCVGTAAGAPSIAIPVKRAEKGFFGITLFCRPGDDGKLLSFAEKFIEIIKR